MRSLDGSAALRMSASALRRLAATALFVAATMSGAAHADKQSNPIVILKGLDKITGEVHPFYVYIDETVQFGSLQITPRKCYNRPPTEPQRTTAFLEIDEITLDRKVRRIFSGWMFAASPGLNALDHAVYDIWLTACSTSVPENLG
jgi:hypothetical protein